MELRASGDGFSIWHGGQCLLFHGAAAPCVSIGRGEARFDMHRGNFDIHGTVLSRTPLPHATVRGGQVELRAQPGGPVRLVLRIELDGSRARIAFAAADPLDNRLWLHRRPIWRRRSGDAASRCLTWTCAGAVSRFGPANPASGATNRRLSRGRPTRRGGRRLPHHQLPAADVPHRAPGRGASGDDGIQRVRLFHARPSRAGSLGDPGAA